MTETGVRMDYAVAETLQNSILVPRGWRLLLGNERQVINMYAKTLMIPGRKEKYYISRPAIIFEERYG